MDTTHSTWEWLLWAWFDVTSLQHQPQPLTASALFCQGPLSLLVLVSAKSRRWWSSESVLMASPSAQMGSLLQPAPAARPNTEDFVFRGLGAKLWAFKFTSRLISVISDLHRAGNFHSTQLHLEDSQPRSGLELSTPTSLDIWTELFGSHWKNQAELPSLGLGVKLISLPAKVMGKMDQGWQQLPVISHLWMKT